MEDVDIITDAKGGDGVFRDIADYILDTQEILYKILKESINKKDISK